jgi:hypothetical protein
MFTDGVLLFPESMYSFGEEPLGGARRAFAKRARSEEPRVFSRRQLMRMRNEDLTELLPEADRPTLTTKADMADRIMERRVLRGVAVAPSPVASPVATAPATPSETPMVSDDPDADPDADSDFESALAIAVGFLADEAAAPSAGAVAAARPPSCSGPIVQPDVKAGDERTMPTQVTLQVITDGDMKFIDTIEEPSAEKVRSVMPPTAGYSYVWLVLQNAQFRLDFCYHPTETGMAHKLICTMIRPSGKRFAYALPCCIVHNADTGAIGIAMDTSRLWAPGMMPEPNSPLTIFASWLEKYTGFSLVCLISE